MILHLVDIPVSRFELSVTNCKASVSFSEYLHKARFLSFLELVCDLRSMPGQAAAFHTALSKSLPIAIYDTLILITKRKKLCDILQFQRVLFVSPPLPFLISLFVLELPRPQRYVFNKSRDNWLKAQDRPEAQASDRT